MAISNSQLQALLDLSVSSSANGAPIAITYGTIMVDGNVIWCPGLTETTTTIYNTASHAWVAYYSFSASFAIGWAEGECAVTKIFADNAVLYDNTGAFISYCGEFNSSTMYAVGDIVSYNVLGGRLFELIHPWYTLPFVAPSFFPFVDWWFRLNPWEMYTGSIQVAGGQQYKSPTGMYNGTDDQDVDPTIATGTALDGTKATGFSGLGDMTSAFRGLCYSVFTNLPLEGFSNKIPALRAVVMSKPTYAGSPPVPVSANAGLDVIVTDICERCGIDPAQVDATELASIEETLANTYQDDGTGIPALTMIGGTGTVNFYQGNGPAVMGPFKGLFSDTGAPWKFSYPNTDNNHPLPKPNLTWPLPPTASILWNPYPCDDTYMGHTAPDGLHYASFLPGWTNLEGYNLQPMTVAGVVTGGGLGAANYNGDAWQPFTPMNIGEWHECNWDMAITCQLHVAVAGTYTFKVSSNDAVIIGIGNGASRAQNPSTEGGGWGPMIFSTTYHAPGVLTKTALNGLPIMMAKNVDMGTNDNIGGTDPHTGLPYMNSQLSTFSVSLPAGLVTMEVDYGCHVNGRVLCINWMNNGTQSPLLPISVATQDAIAEPFGFLIADQKDGKSLINNLQAGFFFDLCESDYKLKFKRRGLTAAGTPKLAAIQIPETDLGLVDDKKKIVETVTQEQDAPKTVIVNFLDNTPGLDYQQSSQQKMRSSRTVTTLNQKTVDLTSLAISGQEARSIAEKTLFSDWMERSPYEFNLAAPNYLALDPTDVTQFVFEGKVYQERLKTLNIGQGYACETTGVSQLPTAYASAVVGAPVSPVVVTVIRALETDEGGYLLQEDGSHFLITS